MMKLSEAIREGAQFNPQTQGSPMVIDLDGHLSTCALGAAYRATHALAPADMRHCDEPMTEDFFQSFGIDLETLVEHPKLNFPARIIEAIYRLNDTHHLTREAIADWLKGLGY